MSADVAVAIVLVLGTFAACLLHSAWHHFRHHVPLESYDWKGDRR